MLLTDKNTVPFGGETDPGRSAGAKFRRKSRHKVILLSIRGRSDGFFTLYRARLI